MLQPQLSFLLRELGFLNPVSIGVVPCAIGLLICQTVS